MCDNSPQHMSSLLAIVQKAAAPSESPSPKKDSYDSIDDARRCAIAALGSIVQLKDSSKHIRNVISTLLQALSDNTGSSLELVCVEIVNCLMIPQSHAKRCNLCYASAKIHSLKF